MIDRESNSWQEKDSINTYLIDTYQVCDSFAHCHGYFWGVCNTPLHGYTENRSFRVGSFNGESNFWSVNLGAYCIRPRTYRVFDSMNRMESNFWSVRVVSYCIRPKMYQVDDSIDRGESNFWSIGVGAYCIRPKTYRVGESMDKRELIFWFVRVEAYCIRPSTYRAGDSIVFRHTNFCRV